MIEAGAAGVHFGRPAFIGQEMRPLGRQVLVPRIEFVQKLVAARLAADILGVPTI